MFEQLKRILKDSLVYGSGSVAQYSISFLLIPVYTRYLTPSDYGIPEVVTVTLSVLLVVYIMGMSTAILRCYLDTQEESTRKTVASSAFVYLSLASLTLTLMLVFLASFFSSVFFGSGENTHLFVIAFVTLFFDTSLAVPLALFRARGESNRYVIVSVSRFALGMGLNVLFVVGLTKGVLGILQAHLITSVLVYLAVIPWVIRYAGIRFSVRKLREMLSFGLPLVATSLGAQSLIFADRYFLNFFSSVTEVGLYALGYKFGFIVSGLIAQPFQLAWLPFMFSIKDEQNAREVFSRILTYFALVVVFIALALSVLAKPVLWLVTTPPFYSAWKVVPLIAFSYAIYGCYFVVAAPFYLTDRTRFLTYLVISAALANLVLNYLLVPGYGMIGAGIATFISYTALFLATALIGKRHYPIPYESSRVLKIFLAAGLVFTSSLYVTHSSPLGAGLLKLASLLGFPTLLLAFKFFRRDEIRRSCIIIRAVMGRPKVLACMVDKLQGRLKELDDAGNRKESS